MASAHSDRDELSGVIERVAREARDVLDGLDERPLRAGGLARAERAMSGPLPEDGAGAHAALHELIELAHDAAVTSSGPRFFHFVMGGVTPAALGGDWLATLYDQVAYAWLSSPLATRLEQLCLAWLRELFVLPRDGGGVMTTGATMANFVGLAAARQWWGERLGVDVSEQGTSGLPRPRVLTSGYVHASTVKALAMLGIGRGAVRRLARDGVGRLDEDALRAELSRPGEPPAIVVANAGEVNAGDFDPIASMAELARAHGAWLHVDGAFGLFARLCEETASIAAGAEHGDSICVDGHKWLNVPYDCGFAFVRDASLLHRAFSYSADYLQAPGDPRPNFGILGPESSRRARALAVFATLRAYGRSGHRAMVARHLALARHLAARVDAAPDLDRLAEVALCVVCFRYDPGGLPEDELDTLNAALGAAVLEDGRVFVGTTRYDGKVALRPAIVNWRTRERDVELLVEVVRELGARLAATR